MRRYAVDPPRSTGVPSTCRASLSARPTTAYGRPVRASGVLDEHSPLVGADHLCWVYDDPSSFVHAALRYLAEGVAHGERLLCIGDGLDDELRAAGEPFGSIDELVAEGMLSFQSVGDTYVDGGPVSPADQWAFYDAAVRAARAAGYRGLRVVAEITALARSASGRAGLVAWEHLADEYIASGSGMVAMCAYDRGALDAEAVADVTAVHPQVHAPLDPPSFRIWFDGSHVAIAGMVDTFGAARLARVLAASPVTGPTAVLDLSGLEVVDVGGCRTLAAWARSLADRGIRLRVQGAPRAVVRIWRLLGMDGPAPVTFAGAVG
jgi:ABC-type transporter Mla MlaB component